MLKVTVVTLMFFWAGGCGDDFIGHPDLYLIDAFVCPIDPHPGCCRFYPDEDAIRACEQPDFPDCACGVIVCQSGIDAGALKINVCGDHPDTCP